MSYNEGENDLYKMIDMFESMISEPDGTLCKSRLSGLYNSPNTTAIGVEEFINSAKGIVDVIQTVVKQLTLLEMQFPNEQHITVRLKERYVKCEQHLLTMMNKVKEWNK
jgi:hypothetical protein